MKFFIDTANLNEIREMADFGLLDGVTTNPSLMAKEGVTDFNQRYLDICELVDGDVSAEVISTSFDAMVDEGRALASIHPRVVVKVPMTPDGVKAISSLRGSGIRTNCTLIFSPMQALVAAKAGATYVSPFVGRLDDVAHDGIMLIRSIRTIFDNYEIGCKILAASLRHTLHLVQAAEEGADVSTAPFSVLMGLFKHPLTDLGLERFLSDYRKLQERLKQG